MSAHTTRTSHDELIGTVKLELPDWVTGHRSDDHWDYWCSDTEEVTREADFSDVVSTRLEQRMMTEVDRTKAALIYALCAPRVHVEADGHGFDLDYTGAVEFMASIVHHLATWQGCEHSEVLERVASELRQHFTE